MGFGLKEKLIKLDKWWSGDYWLGTVTMHLFCVAIVSMILYFGFGIFSWLNWLTIDVVYALVAGTLDWYTTVTGNKQT